MKNLSIAKHDVTTSTKNIHSITHYSFLMHVKEIENIDTVCSQNIVPPISPIAIYLFQEGPNSKIVITTKNESKLPTFRSLLSQMLHTSAESIIDSQWELRRMAKQALPPLGEVLRWFDPELLVNIINTHLKFEPTLMTSICLQLLLDSLLHTSRLKLLITNPPSSWQVASQIHDNDVIIANTLSAERRLSGRGQHCDQCGIKPVTMDEILSTLPRSFHGIRLHNAAYHQYRHNLHFQLFPYYPCGKRSFCSHYSYISLSLSSLI